MNARREMGSMLEGQIAIVTGSGEGIGAGIATTLGEFGAKVAITDIDLSRAQRRVEILASQGIESMAVQHDVTDGESGKRLVQQVLSAYGRVDLLVNNAGISGRVPLEEMSDQ
ncbi:MAG: SDR family NAD(P)-dependent oxidoreductase, partial [Actinobacteria bacterium]|nr:SDR family NAD(P)-dependent oxidoreductase [Actinomycetota bacterium]